MFAERGRSCLRFPPRPFAAGVCPPVHYAAASSAVCPFVHTVNAVDDRPPLPRAPQGRERFSSHARTFSRQPVDFARPDLVTSSTSTPGWRPSSRCSAQPCQAAPWSLRRRSPSLGCPLAQRAPRRRPSVAGAGRPDALALRPLPSLRALPSPSGGIWARCPRLWRRCRPFPYVVSRVSLL